jgi:chromosome segregation ATPase
VNPNEQQNELSETPTPWAMETMQLINKLTPDVQGKAFDPDWFLLRQRLEEKERELSALKKVRDEEKARTSEATRTLAVEAIARRTAETELTSLRAKVRVARKALHKIAQNNCRPFDPRLSPTADARADIDSMEREAQAALAQLEEGK